MYEEGAEVTVAGTVRAGGLIVAPITGYPCVVAWTRARVWDRLDLAGTLVEDFVNALTRLVGYPGRPLTISR
jgi:hypothetical protein